MQKYLITLKLLSRGCLSKEIMHKTNATPESEFLESKESYKLSLFPLLPASGADLASHE